jgi:hypothetical protein
MCRETFITLQVLANTTDIKKAKMKLTLQQVVEAHKVVRRRGSTFYR